MTKKELLEEQKNERKILAAFLMAALMVNKSVGCSLEQVAEEAVHAADLLLEKLA